MMVEAAGSESTPVTPAYWVDACKHLVKKDRVMRKLIPKFGDACLQIRGDAFVTLARSIVGQQIAVASAQRVWDRFALLPHNITPANVLRLKVDDMRAAGLSARKVEYLVDLALHFDNGALHVDNWANMQDEEIIEELVAIRGIGRWTAQMFLIFALGREDVFPIDDFGVRAAISRLHGFTEMPPKAVLLEIGQRWSPYASIASWYCWRYLDVVKAEQQQTKKKAPSNVKKNSG